MRILLVNYRYWVSSGPERYMFNLTSLLKSAGHQVVPFSVAYDMNQPTPFDRYFVPPIAGTDEAYFSEHTWTPASFARALGRTFYSREVYRALTTLVQEHRPDAAIVMQYLRKMSPSVLTALRDQGIPCLVRLSDYAMVCAEAHQHRGGRHCSECAGGRLLPGVVHRCVRSSLGASTVNAAATLLHRTTGWYDIPHAYLTPSSALRAAMLGCYQWPEDRVRLLPTFVPRRDYVTPAADRLPTIVYVGRLDRTKGVDVLIQAYRLFSERCQGSPPLLLIAGGGVPAEVDRIQQSTIGMRWRSRIEFRGELRPEEALDLLSSAAVSVVPSICVENLPNSLLESLACGTPVIASDTTSLAEALSGSGAGMLVPAGDASALAEALEQVLGAGGDARQAMVEAAVARANDRFSAVRHLTLLSSILQEALPSGSDRSRSPAVQAG